jgi:hypothetical protein
MDMWGRDNLKQKEVYQILKPKTVIIVKSIFYPQYTRMISKK